MFLNTLSGPANIKCNSYMYENVTHTYMYVNYINNVSIVRYNNRYNRFLMEFCFIIKLQNRGAEIFTILPDKLRAQ